MLVGLDISEYGDLHKWHGTLEGVRAWLERLVR